MGGCAKPPAVSRRPSPLAVDLPAEPFDVVRVAQAGDLVQPVGPGFDDEDSAIEVILSSAASSPERGYGEVDKNRREPDPHGNMPRGRSRGPGRLNLPPLIPGGADYPKREDGEEESSHFKPQNPRSSRRSLADRFGGGHTASNRRMAVAHPP